MQHCELTVSKFIIEYLLWDSHVLRLLKKRYQKQHNCVNLFFTTLKFFQLSEQTKNIIWRNFLHCSQDLNKLYTLNTDSRGINELHLRNFLKYCNIGVDYIMVPLRYVCSFFPKKISGRQTHAMQNLWFVHVRVDR